jgi:hypothetical protein
MNAYLSGDPEQQKDIIGIINREFPCNPYVSGSNTVAISLPYVLSADVGPNIEFEVEIDASGQNMVAFDVPGAAPAAITSYIVNPGQTGIPMLIITPARAGGLSLSIEVTEYVSDGNGGWNLNSSATVDETINLVIVNT